MADGRTTTTRVDALKAAYEGGLRIETLREDSSPWVRRGLEVLEKGEELTEKMLLEADNAQTMRSPESK
jgi:hypothetical protein